MHTVKIELTRDEALGLEEKLLEVANDRGKELNFSILLLPTRALLTGYFKNRAASLEQLGLIGMEARAQHGFLRDRDWMDSVRKHFKPLIYRDIAWVPSWQKALPKSFAKKKIKTVIRLDIGMAFGTGNHPTTRLCLRRLIDAIHSRIETNRARGGASLNNFSVLDIGCGSGILAITADKLKVAKSQGFDLDEHSIVVARRNGKLNRSRAKFSVQDLYKVKLEKSDIVLANLLANLIADNAKKLWAAVKPGGTLILSGLLKEELDTTAKLFPSRAKKTILGKWGVLMIQKL